MSNLTEVFDGDWTTKKPLQGVLKDMPTPPHGLPAIKVSAAEDFIYLALNFITETGSLRGQTLVGGTYIVTSYGTPIGIIKNGRHILNVTEYSKTTSTHQKIVLDAWDSMQVFNTNAESLVNTFGENLAGV